jgi:hypothetical protein
MGALAQKDSEEEEAIHASALAAHGAEEQAGGARPSNALQAAGAVNLKRELKHRKLTEPMKDLIAVCQSWPGVTKRPPRSWSRS